MERDSHSTSPRYLGRAHGGTVSFFRGPRGKLLIERVEDGVSLFIGESDSSEIFTRNSQWPILVCLRDGTVFADVPIVSTSEPGTIAWMKMSYIDLTFAIEMEYVSRSELRFHSSIEPLINLRK